jgi:hypothetical protein
MIIQELKNYHLDAKPHPIDDYVAERTKAHETYVAEMATVAASPALSAKNPKRTSMPEARPMIAASAPSRQRLLPRKVEYVDRRGVSLMSATTPKRDRRRTAERRRKKYAIPFQDRRLTRSAYEQVFLKLVSGGRLRVGGDLYTPVGMKGWYHAIFRNAAGEERLITIDQLLKKMNDWV